MTQEQIVSLARQLLLFGGGILVSRGWIDQETLVTISGAVAALAGSAWALYSRRQAGVVAAAAKLPGVVVTTPDVGLVEAAGHPDVRLMGWTVADARRASFRP